jgi:hypothetical protein
LSDAQKGLVRESEVNMSPIKQAAVGIGGCVLVAGGNLYRLQNGAQTYNVAVTVSLLLAEPSLRRRLKSEPMRCDEATAQGYRVVRSYDEAIAHGIV